MNNKKDNKRGWLLDQLMLIGHYEAELTHDDEQLINLDHDAENSDGEIPTIEKLSDETNFRENLTAIHYEGRAKAEEDVFNAFPDIEIDEKKWCDIKHSCAIYILACETYHARNLAPEAKENMIIAGKALIMLVSRVFGFEPMDCMRCFNDRLSATDKLESEKLIFIPSRKEDITSSPNSGKILGISDQINMTDNSDSITKTPKVDAQNPNNLNTMGTIL